MSFDQDTVKSTEKMEELAAKARVPKLARVPDTLKGYAKGRIRNYTCPACGKVLKEAVTINGEVRGMCGVKHVYVGSKGL